MLLSNLVAMNVARQQLLWCHAAAAAPSSCGPAGVAVVQSELLLSSQTHPQVESASRARRCTLGWSGICLSSSIHVLVCLRAEVCRLVGAGRNSVGEGRD